MKRRTREGVIEFEPESEDEVEELQKWQNELGDGWVSYQSTHPDEIDDDEFATLAVNRTRHQTRGLLSRLWDWILPACACLGAGALIGLLIDIGGWVLDQL